MQNGTFFFTNLVYRDLIKNYSIYIVYAPIQVYGENVFSLKFRVKITVSTKSMVYGKELHRLIFYQIFSQKFFFLIFIIIISSKKIAKILLPFIWTINISRYMIQLQKRNASLSYIEYLILIGILHQTIPML